MEGFSFLFLSLDDVGGGFRFTHKKGKEKDLGAEAYFSIQIFYSNYKIKKRRFRAFTISFVDDLKLRSLRNDDANFRRSDSMQ